MIERDSDLQRLWDRRDRILEGKVNCIPLEFPRLSNFYYGLEETGFNIYTASQKVGKSKLVDEMCVYNPFFYSLEHPDQLSVKIIYFSLEISKEKKLYEFYSHLLFKLDDIRVSPKDLQSTKFACDGDILVRLDSERYQYYIKKFKETVDYITTIKNPTGIYKYCKEFALSRGHWIMKPGKVKNEFGNFIDGEVKDKFIKENPDEYWIIVFDNFTNLTIENNYTKPANMEKMSKYFIELRDDYRFNINAVQHQAQSQEGIENRKLNQLEPSSDGLGDCKVTVRDVENLWGLFNPFKYGIKRYPEGDKSYDITKLKDYARFLKILEGRDGGMGVSIGLFFDGETASWKELPAPDNLEEMQQVYRYVDYLEEKRLNKERFNKSFILYLINKFKHKTK